MFAETTDSQPGRDGVLEDFCAFRHDLKTCLGFTWFLVCREVTEPFQGLNLVLGSFFQPTNFLFLGEVLSVDLGGGCCPALLKDV